MRREASPERTLRASLSSALMWLYLVLLLAVLALCDTQGRSGKKPVIAEGRSVQKRVHVAWHGEERRSRMKMALGEDRILE